MAEVVRLGVPTDGAGVAARAWGGVCAAAGGDLWDGAGNVKTERLLP